MSEDIEYLKRIWKKRWEESKEKIREKADEMARNWTEITPHKEEAWKTGISRAAEKHLWSKGVSNVSSEEWKTATLQGWESKTLTDYEAEKFAGRAAPYIAVVREAKREFKKINFKDPIEAGKWWLENVSKLLREARRSPEKLPQIRNEIMRRISEAQRAYGTSTKGLAK